MCSSLVWKNACLNYREFDLEVDLVGVPHTWYLSAQSFITHLQLSLLSSKAPTMTLQNFERMTPQAGPHLRNKTRQGSRSRPLGNILYTTMRSPRRRRLRKKSRPSRRSRSSNDSRRKHFTSLVANRWVRSWAIAYNDFEHDTVDLSGNPLFISRSLIVQQWTRMTCWWNCALKNEYFLISL